MIQHMFMNVKPTFASKDCKEEAREGSCHSIPLVKGDPQQTTTLHVIPCFSLIVNQCN